MNINQANEFLESFKTKGFGIAPAKRDEQLYIDALSVIIRTAIINNPKIKQIEAITSACFLYLVVNKIHIFIGYSSKMEVNVIKVMSEFDKNLPKRGAINHLFFNEHSSRLRDLTVDLIATKIEAINDFNEKFIAGAKEATKTKDLIKEKIEAINNEGLRDCSLKLNRDKSVVLTINNITMQQLESIHDLLKNK